MGRIGLYGGSSTMIREAVWNMETKGLPPKFFDWCDVNVFTQIYNEKLYTPCS